MLAVDTPVGTLKCKGTGRSRAKQVSLSVRPEAIHCGKPSGQDGVDLGTGRLGDFVFQGRSAGVMPCAGPDASVRLQMSLPPETEVEPDAQTPIWTRSSDIVLLREDAEMSGGDSGADKSEGRCCSAPPKPACRSTRACAPRSCWRRLSSCFRSEEYKEVTVQRIGREHRHHAFADLLLLQQQGDLFHSALVHALDRVMEDINEIKAAHSDPVDLMRAWFQMNIDQAEALKRFVRIMFVNASSSLDVVAADRPQDHSRFLCAGNRALWSKPSAPGFRRACLPAPGPT